MITLTINGKKHQLDIDPDTPLLWVLRDVLKMTGTKLGCGMAMCEDLYLETEVIRSCHEMLLRVSDNLYAKSRARIDAEE